LFPNTLLARFYLKQPNEVNEASRVGRAWAWTWLPGAG
jgi:hypothetical protein